MTCLPFASPTLEPHITITFLFVTELPVLLILHLKVNFPYFCSPWGRDACRKLESQCKPLKMTNMGVLGFI